MELAEGAGDETLPSWSPDGEAALYHSIQPNQTARFVVMNPHGSAQRAAAELLGQRQDEQTASRTAATQWPPDLPECSRWIRKRERSSY